MSLNDTPSANRLHIGFFGLRNAGKSSVVNAVTGQDLAVVSGRPGTTTDPVQKAMELLPLGPVVIIDTPGYDDDEQELGQKRVLRTKRVLNKRMWPFWWSTGRRVCKKTTGSFSRSSAKRTFRILWYSTRKTCLMQRPRMSFASAP